jgi:hypothetical protein
MLTEVPPLLVGVELPLPPTVLTGVPPLLVRKSFEAPPDSRL